MESEDNLLQNGCTYSLEKKTKNKRKRLLESPFFFFFCVETQVGVGRWSPVRKGICIIFYSNFNSLKKEEPYWNVSVNLFFFKSIAFFPLLLKRCRRRWHLFKMCYFDMQKNSHCHIKIQYDAQRDESSEMFFQVSLYPKRKRGHLLFLP